MDLIYSMRRKPLKCEPPNFESICDPEVIRPLCTISSKNIIAFSSSTELSDVDGDSWGGYVYVCDLDTPWDAHKVTTTVHPVSALEWDMEGKQLLVATTVGDVSVFGQKDYLLNDWICLYSASFPGEQIIKSTFFHNGRRVATVDKKPETPITDRMQVLRSTPTLKGFGGMAQDGVCVMTATGLIGVITPPTGTETKAHVATECTPIRGRNTANSISHKNGNLLIATLFVSPTNSCVRCYMCSVSSQGIQPSISLQLVPLPSIYLEGEPPTSITWCLREDTDSLLIAGSSLTMWKLTERAHPVHKLLSKGPVQGNTTPGGGPKPGTDSFNTVVWHRTGIWHIDSKERFVQVSSCRLPVSLPRFVLATAKHLHLLQMDNSHFIASTQVSTHGVGGLAPEPTAVSNSSTPPKKPKYGPGALPSGASCAVVSCCDISWLGGVVVCVDTHSQLHVFAQPANDNIPMPVQVQLATSILEYSMVTGYDCLDVLMTLKSNVAEATYDRLTESFQRQPQTFQQYYYHSWLKLRIALCRVIPNGASTLHWLTCLQCICFLWASVSAALRTDDRPDNPVSVLCTEHHDKALLALETKPELGTEVLNIVSLRRGLQRAADIALTMLAALPPSAQPHTYELYSDPVAVNLLRKLIIVGRACGRSGSTLDALTRPLQRLACNQIKPDLYEECAGLAAQMPSPRVWEALPRCCVSAPSGKPTPYYFEYGSRPEWLRFAPEPSLYAQSDAPPVAMDSIRYMYLGGGVGPARWRECGRCGTRALPASAARCLMQRSADSRMATHCRCGGLWTLVTNV